MVGFIILLQFKHNLSSSQRYFNELDIYGISSATITEMINNDKYRKIVEGDNVTICRDGFKLIAVNANGSYIRMRIELFDGKYRFGRNRVGVSYFKNDIEEVI